MQHYHSPLEIVRWVEDVYPRNLRFNADRETLKTIGTYLHFNNEKSYRAFILMFGILFFLAVIQYFVQQEEYERCTVMLKAIDKVNKEEGWNLPRCIEDEIAQQLTLMEYGDAVNTWIENLKNDNNRTTNNS